MAFEFPSTQLLKIISEHKRLTSVAVLSCLAILMIISRLLLKRLIFHPLAQYPGPFWGRVTNLYTVYHAFLGDRHWDFFKLHQKYGPIVRYGPNCISLLSTTALHNINSPKANTIKSDFYSAFTIAFQAEGSVTTIDKVRHGRKRRILSQALSLKSVEGFEEHILANVERFCGLLLEDAGKASSTLENQCQWSTPKDFGTMASWLAFDAMGDICFNKSFKLLTSETFRWVPATISRGVRYLNIAGNMLWILKLPPTAFAIKLDPTLQTFKAFSEEQARQRIAKTNQLPIKDVFHGLLEGYNDEWLTNEELVAESGILIFAGSDTTALAITSTVHYLLKNPSAMHRLSEEILGSFSATSDIRLGSKLDSCRYLRACINEALRLTPVVGGLLPRQVTAGGIYIDGHYFPEGTVLGVPYYAVHHDPENYVEPFTFKPERWIVDSKAGVTEADVAKAQNAFCVFGSGRTSCIGKHVAYAEVSITLATMLFLIEMKPAVDGVPAEHGWDAKYLREMRTLGELPTKEQFASVAQRTWVCFRPRSQETRRA